MPSDPPRKLKFGGTKRCVTKNRERQKFVPNGLGPSHRAVINAISFAIANENCPPFST